MAHLSTSFVRRVERPWEIWRVPFLGGTPRLLIANVASPIAWAPDGQRIAFLRTRISPSLSSQLFVAGADGGQERELASQGGFPAVDLTGRSLATELPSGLVTRRPAHCARCRGPTGGQIVFVDSGTGSIQDVTVPNGTMDGLSWLDARSLVLNHPAQLGAPNQLFRQPYPAGPLSRLTNDPNDYVGISLSGDRRRLVTSRRDARMDFWVGDGGAATGADVVQRVPVSNVERVAWAGDRLLYAGVVGGKPAILRVTPGENTPEDVVLEALAPAATSDGRTIVFVSSADNTLDLWTADASGRRKTRLVPSVTADQVAVTPDDRFVLFTSLVGGTVSIWMVPIEGGSPTKLTDGSSAAVSPDGGSIAFTARRRRRTVTRRLQSSRLQFAANDRPRAVSTRRSPGPRTVAASPTRATGICGCSRSAAALRVSSRASPTAVRSNPLRGRATASAWPSRDRPSPTTSCCSRA